MCIGGTVHDDTYMLAYNCMGDAQCALHASHVCTYVIITLHMYVRIRSDSACVSVYITAILACISRIIIYIYIYIYIYILIGA